MRRKIEQFLSNEERASRIILNWIVGFGMAAWLIGISAYLLMRSAEG